MVIDYVDIDLLNKINHNTTKTFAGNIVKIDIYVTPETIVAPAGGYASVILDNLNAVEYNFVAIPPFSNMARLATEKINYIDVLGNNTFLLKKQLSISNVIVSSFIKSFYIRVYFVVE